METEFQRRRERDEIWYEEPLSSPKKPVLACVAPLTLRKKASLLKEGEETDIEKPQLSPERVSSLRSTTGHSAQRSGHHAHSSSVCTRRPLSIIHEESGSAAPRSFFEFSDDEEEPRDRRYRFPLPSPNKASLQDDVEVFSIGSFSESEESSEASGH